MRGLSIAATLLIASAAAVAPLAAPAPASADEGAAEVAPAEERPRVDVVFCIDCSGSMGGVIETAKQKVWAIVNEVARAKPTPQLRIGLMGYGDADRQFRTFPLSDDLDEVYKNLTTFKDEGWGDEYVGLMIHKATNEMPWGTGKNDLKVIYVVGNETARQGPAEFDYAKTAPAAIAKGIIVNAIYCQNGSADSTWMDLASLADGKYLQIAADGGAVAVATPYDQELGELSAKLNKTYVGYGRRGAAALANQQAQDQAAATLPNGSVVAAERAQAKASLMYQNAGWDLIDASKQKDFDLSKVEADQLPEEMRKMSAEERAKYLEQKATERAEVQKQIGEVAAKRDAHVKAELEKQGRDGKDALDVAVRSSIKEQAAARGFKFEE
jgi:hypothetical protein